MTLVTDQIAGFPSSVTKALLPPAVFYSTKPKSNRKSYLVMKPIISFALLGALFAVGAANAAVTDPVGYVTLGDTTAGQPSIKAQTDIVASIPLDQASVFAGTVASVAGNIITISGTPALGSFTGTPHVAKIEGGAKSGLVSLITANDATTVTVTVPTGDSLAGIVAGDAITIRPAWTLLKLATGNTLPAGTQLLAFGGSTPGINLASDAAYEWDGTAWTDLNSFDLANNVVLFTGESFVIRNGTNTPVTSFVVTGEVPTSNSRVVVSKLAAGVGQDNRLAYVSPVSEVIGVSGLGAALVSGDQLLVFNNGSAGINKAASSVIEWDGSAWTDLDTFDNVTNTFSLVGGNGYVIRKGSAAAVSDVVWSDAPTYVPTL